MGSPWPTSILEKRPDDDYAVGGALGGGTAAPGITATWPASTVEKRQDEPSTDQLLPNAPYGFNDMLMHGVSFGLSDVGRAGIGAGTDYLLGAPNAAPGEAERGFDFQRRSEEIARGRQHYQAEHPWISTAADLLGSAAMAPAMAGKAIATTAEKAPSLWRQLLASTGLGTAGGAVTGAADNPDDRLGSAINYGAGGAIAGAISPLAIRAGTGLATGFRNLANAPGTVEANALDRLRGIVGDEESIGLPSLRDLHQRIMGSDAPLSLADVSPSVQRDMGSLYNRITPASPLIKSDLKAIDKQAGPRILNWLDRRAATGPETFEANAIITANQKRNAAKLYPDAYMQPPINPDLVGREGELGRLIDTPAGKEAMAKALKIAEQDKVSPTVHGLGFDADGNVQFTKVPSWQTLDYVKRGFDDVVNDLGQHNPLTGKQEHIGKWGQSVTATLAEYRDILRRENPAYGAALDAWSGDQSAKNALAEGAHAFAPGRSAAEQKSIYNRFDAGDQELYRLAATNALRQKVRTTPFASDESKRLLQNPDQTEKLGLVFKKPEDHADFVRMLEDEGTIFDKDYAIAGGSQTAHRSGAMGESEEHPLVTALPAALGLAAAGQYVPALAVGGGAMLRPKVESGLTQFFNRWRGNTPEAQVARQRLAFAPGPAGTFGPSAADRTMGLLSLPPPDRRLAPGWVPGTMTGVNALGSVPALSNPTAQFLAGTRAPPLTEAERAQLARERNARPGAPGRLPR